MRKLAALLLAFAAAASTYAITVFDPANYSQNIVTALQSVKSTAQQVTSYSTQLQQYRAQLQNLIPIDAAKAQMLLADNALKMRDATAASQSLQQLYGSVANLQGTFQQRLDMASALKMTWSQYQQYERSRIASNQEDAVQRAKEELRVAQRVNDDYQFAKDAADRIPNTAGTQESLQLMNLQMNRMLTQNAEVIQGLQSALASQNSANQMTQKNARAQRDLSERQYFKDLGTARQSAEKAALDSWNAQ